MVKLRTKQQGMPDATFYFNSTVDQQEFVETFKRKGFVGKYALPWGQPEVQKEFTGISAQQEDYLDSGKSGHMMALEHLDWACSYLAQIHPAILGHQCVTVDAMLRRIQNVPV